MVNKERLSIWDGSSFYSDDLDLLNGMITIGK
jgi:hypothetical protein